ncbi:MAG: M28 family peptidase [Caldilineaceae bacterium]|nr:M28 family peptidase [Caldilineaceae bacterium]
MQGLRLYSIELVLVAALLGAIGFFGYLGYGLVYTTPTFSGGQAYHYVVRQVEKGERNTGSANNLAVGDWLAQEVAGADWQVYIQPFSLANGFEARNIIAISSTAAPSTPVVLLAAHYDTRFFADADPTPELRVNAPLGANSNASGVALLLELVRTLNVEDSGYTFCLALFDADDNGNLQDWEPFWGSRFFVQNAAESIDRCRQPQLVIVVDTVGYPGQSLSIVAENDVAAVRDSLQQVANELGYASKFRNDNAGTITTPLLQLGAPTLMITSFTYPYRYTTQDTVDKVSAETLLSVGRTLETWLERGNAP